MQQIEWGDAFIIQTPPKDWHLYIIIATISDSTYLLVNTTTSNTQIDQEKDCIIHPSPNIPSFITCSSTIAYRHARDYRKNEIKQFIKKGIWQYSGRFPQEYIHEMQLKGAFSKKIKRKYKTVLREIIEIKELNRIFG
ncbi:MAG: hypothetical protein ABI417_04175 [Coleofasciculaceae cyanobacterium]